MLSIHLEVTIINILFILIGFVTNLYSICNIVREFLIVLFFFHIDIVNWSYIKRLFYFIFFIVWWTVKIFLNNLFFYLCIFWFIHIIGFIIWKWKVRILTIFTWILIFFLLFLLLFGFFRWLVELIFALNRRVRRWTWTWTRCESLEPSTRRWWRKPWCWRSSSSLSCCTS